MCGEGARSILLLPLMSRCLETIDVCKGSSFFYCVCVRDVMNVVFSVCIVTRGAVGVRVWEV